MTQYSKTKVVIITCWILLFLAFIAKLFGADIFDISVENQKLVSICEWLDNHIVYKYIVSTIIYIPTTYLVYLTMVKRKIGQDLWIIIVSIPCSTLKGWNQYLGFALDAFILIVLPLLRCKFRNWLWVILGILAIVVFQEISLFIRNQNFILDKEFLLINIIMSIDYYIMVVLYYLHVTYFKIFRKEKEKI